MKNTLIAILALMAIFGVSTWAFETLRQRTFMGEGLSVEVGSGTLSVTNLGDAPVAVEMRAAGGRAFRIKSALFGMQDSAARSGDGAEMRNAVAFELPPGQVTIDVIRGSAVWFVSHSNTPLQATVTPLRAEGVQLTIMFAGAIILIALYSISSTMQHRWVELLRDRGSEHIVQSTEGVQNRENVTS